MVHLQQWGAILRTVRNMRLHQWGRMPWLCQRYVDHLGGFLCYVMNMETANLFSISSQVKTLVSFARYRACAKEFCWTKIWRTAFNHVRYRSRKREKQPKRNLGHFSRRNCVENQTSAISTPTIRPMACAWNSQHANQTMRLAVELA